MSSSTTNPIIAPLRIHTLLLRLHHESLTQETLLRSRYTKNDAADFDTIVRDAFIALDQEKCQFIYQISRATAARNIVEVGTSFGVSTIYLALAVARNLEIVGGEGRVIATEKESGKAEKARAYWREAGEECVSRYIELREGDLLETLKRDLPVIDLVLLDIWTPVALPALKILEPRTRKGAVVIVDNIVDSAEGYADLLDHLMEPANGYTNLTLPYDKGLQMSIKF
ncbi:hypothetical protein BOTCAL_0039g00300 [Botryotinia calthae]|uniref:O-methyltransferase domain-containing protein n=1 Tax=Botryotinia calthae TaxID=38488 RepID=A0A4Y8DCA2_9HELO|nr:hypothetical protein BOTCAL_0039g00300 [Botryotinia calthae]